MDAIIDAWLAKDPDPTTREEIAQLRRDNAHATLADRFSGRVGFGTAGLRALMGAGPTRMNRLVIQQSTTGLGRYVQAQRADADTPAVAVVGFDGRHLSHEFAADTARVLCALGFVVHLFEREIPTPVAGFAVKQLGAAIGIVITASHNPPGYNGYKVYWHNGAQIIGPHDSGIAKAIDAAAQLDPVPLRPLAELLQTKQVQSLGAAMETAYMTGIFAILNKNKPAAPAPAPLHVAYSPLHGVGGRFAKAAVARMPEVVLHTVAAQSAPDGDFPTVRFPNPEEDGAMDLVLALASSIDADIALANDPDADRLALAVRTPQGSYQLLSGNELGALLGDDCLQSAGPKDVVATTIVSSRLLSRMAQAHHVAYFETLTGFKWIANGAIARQAQGQRLIFGYEEALGYILGDLVWDKDGIMALVAVCALAQRLKSQGTTLLERLEALYRQYGLHLTHQHTLATDPSRQGRALGTLLRAHPPQHIDGHTVLRIDDLMQPKQPASTAQNQVQTEPAPLPQSDVLIYTLANNARIIVRPSGTEPKLKCYYELCAPLSADANMFEAQATWRDALNRLCANHQLQLQALLAAERPQA
jgi:phosphomannomutase